MDLADEPLGSYMTNRQKGDQALCVVSEVAMGNEDDFEIHKAQRFASLPQYRASDDFMNRFLDAIQDDDAEVSRARPAAKGTHFAADLEVNSDLLSFFIDRKPQLETEFVDELSKVIGVTKANLFCETIANEWFDGRAKRVGGNVCAIKRGIKSYLETVLESGVAIDQIVQNPDLEAGNELLNRQDIASLLSLNCRMIDVLIDDWIEARPTSATIGRSDIFFRRGIVIDKLFEDRHAYIEYDYINSYSLSTSVVEKFSQDMRKKSKLPAIINADCDYFRGRILFLSIFIPRMAPHQFELGNIPAGRPDALTFQSVHSGVAEYLVGEYPSTGTEDLNTLLEGFS